jgi:hypothetical protein
MNMPYTFALLAAITHCAASAPGAEAGRCPPATPPERPANAIVLFDGSDLDAWRAFDAGRPARANIVDGAFDLEKCNIVTAREFGDLRLYLEFLCPENPPEVTGQRHANSGVYFHDRYELQILGHRGDALPTDKEVGAIYGVKAPDRVATRPDGTWQSFDCVFRAPRFDEAGKKVRDARLTVHHNGTLIHDEVPIPRPTGGARGEEQASGPVRLQDKNHPVLFRNIWVVPLDPD